VLLQQHDQCIAQPRRPSAWHLDTMVNLEARRRGKLVAHFKNPLSRAQSVSTISTVAAKVRRSASAAWTSALCNDRLTFNDKLTLRSSLVGACAALSVRLTM
jgi:hypothetical protein